jgi:multidrug efflux pump subunit AcrA (membrane-fusion protein)
MFAQGEILTGVEARAVIVPATAVYRDDRSAKTSYVYVAENGKAARREVRIGRERETSLEIAAGLRPGDSLISEQSIELAEGVRVTPASGGAGK